MARPKTDRSSRDSSPSGAARPAVRAASVHDVLRYLDKFELGATDRVREAIPDDVLAVIDATPRRGWVDVEDDVYVPTTIWSILGEEDAKEMLREFLQGHFDIPLLRPLVQSTRKLFGLTPMNVLRVLPSGWRLVYRGICRLEVRSVDTGSAEMILNEVTPVVLASTPYLSSFAAVFQAVIDLTDFSGEVVIADIDPSKRRVIYHLRWWRD